MGIAIGPAQYAEGLFRDPKEGQALDPAQKAREKDSLENSVIGRMGTIVGAQYDPQRKRWVKPDGTAATKADFLANREPISNLLLLSYDIKKGTQAAERRLVEQFRAGQISEAQLQDGMKKTRDPAMMLEHLRGQEQMLIQAVGEEVAAPKLAKIRQDMTEIKGQMEKAEERQFRLDLEQKKHDYDMARERYSQGQMNARDADKPILVIDPDSKETGWVGVGEPIPKGKVPIQYASTLTKTEKPDKSTFQKEAEFLASVKGISLSDATDEIRKDKTLAERLRAYTTEVEQLGISLMQATPEERAAAVKAVAEKYKLFDEASDPSGKTIVKTGVQKSTGKKVVQYSDGTIEYAD
jgi:hypothetical protein